MFSTREIRTTAVAACGAMCLMTLGAASASAQAPEAKIVVAAAQPGVSPLSNAAVSAVSVAAAEEPAQAPAAAAEPAKPSFFDDVEIFGLADLYYSAFSNKPTGDAQLRVFDQRHNQFGISMVGIGAAKVPTADSRAGFRVDLNFGPGMRVFHATEPGPKDVIENIQEGYVSYLLPVGKGLQVDAGKFVTPIGAELTEAKDNWNYSRAYLFFAGPYYHSGVRVSYAVNDMISLSGTVVNGWNNVYENNEGKTVNAQIIIKPTAKLSIVQNYMFGPEQADNDDDYRKLSDTVVTFTATDKLALMLNYDNGRDTFANTKANWQGVAAYAKFQPTASFAVTPRYEWFDDKDAFASGTSQKLQEFTLTGDFMASANSSWRVEYRGDFSDEDFFQKRDGSMTDSQHSITFGFLYSFSSKR